MLGDGNILLMWGYLVVVVSLLVWGLLAMTGNAVWNWLWFLIWIVGGIATPVMARRKLVDKGMTSYTDKLASGIWSVVGYSFIAAVFLCLGFLLFRGADSWVVMLVVSLTVVPFAEIAQGLLINEKSIVAGGSLGLLAGIFTLCCIAGGVPLAANWYMPLYIIAFTCMMIVPGHIVNRKARLQR